MLSREAGLSVARMVFGAFFCANGLWILTALLTGLVGAPHQPTKEADEFMRAQTSAHFMEPLLAAGRYDEGVAQLRKAHELAPNDPQTKATLDAVLAKWKP